jgi:hypothetical protein
MALRNYTITYKLGNYPEITQELKAESEEEAKQKAYDKIIQEDPELKKLPINFTGCFGSDQ